MFKLIKKLFGLEEEEPQKRPISAAPVAPKTQPEPAAPVKKAESVPTVPPAPVPPRASETPAAPKKAAKKKPVAKKTAGKAATGKKPASAAKKKAPAKKAEAASGKPVAKKAAAKKTTAKTTRAATKATTKKQAAKKTKRGGSMNADYVVVGAGPAGVAACETLRSADPKGSILLISGETEPPYSRMAIPYVLTGLIEEPGTYLRKQDDHYKAQSIKVHHGEVESINAAKKTLKLGDGGSCGYGKLLVATGASPIKPPVEGLDLPGVHHCWTLEDARAIAEHAGEGSRVVLMGAGFIGCIILEAIAARGAKLTVVEAENRMVPRMMNDTAGNLIKKWCEEKGMNCSHVDPGHQTGEGR